MKDEKAKYFILDSLEIKKQLYHVTREFACNDFYNIYIPKGMESANYFFEKNGVPTEFRKIVVKINIPFCLKKEAYEYTMGFPFDITAGKIENENNKKSITVFSCPVYDYDANQVFNNKVKFKTELRYSNFDDVMEFLLGVDNAGYLKQYLKTIKEFFDISIDLDFIESVWLKSNKNIRVAKRILKKKLS